MGNTVSCGSAITLSGNPFASYNLWTNTIWAAEVNYAATQIPDLRLAGNAREIGAAGSFYWIDTIAQVATMDALIKAVPCGSIIGFVIYDLPGRDCSAGASGGELNIGQVDVYKSQFIDAIRRTVLANPNTAIALIIEPDSLPNMITNINITYCGQAAQGYRDGISYALAQLNLPNIAMYMDAGNSGWLGWVDNIQPGAKEISDVWKAAGSPGQVRGFSTNVANYNAFDLNPGEFSQAPDAKYNPAQNEKLYVNQLSAALAAHGMPAYGIVDTSRNGRTGLRHVSGSWCNVKGAGFGALPTSFTGDAMTDAFVWVKLGGESDGASSPGDKGYSDVCAGPDAFQPSPAAGSWNQAYFQDLVANAVAIPNYLPANTGYWFGGTGTDNKGGVFLQHSTTYVPGANGLDPSKRDWCYNIQSKDPDYALINRNDPLANQASNLLWMTVDCDIPEVVNTGFNYSPAERWAAAHADDALYQAWLCWRYTPAIQAQFHSWSKTAFNYFHGPDGNNCEIFGEGCLSTVSCDPSGHAAGFLIMNSFVSVHQIVTNYDEDMTNAWTAATVSQIDNVITTFSPNVQPDNLKWLKILLDVVGLGFALAAAPVWNIGLKQSARWASAPNELGWIKDSTNAAVGGGITLIKDSISPAKSGLAANEQLRYMAGELLRQWKDSNSRSLAAIFSPESDNFGTFSDLAMEGAMLDLPTYDRSAAQKSFTRALFASLIPWAWSLSNDQHHPFIMIPNNSNGCLVGSDVDAFIDPSAQADAFNCIGGLPFYLVSAKDGCFGCAQECSKTPNGQDCKRHLFRAVPGIKQLVAENNTWLVTRDMMVQGSVNTWRKFGNGYTPDLSSPAAYADFTHDFDFGKGDIASGDSYKQAGGMFRFPVCTADEAWANLNKNGMKDNPNYPCNP